MCRSLHKHVEKNVFICPGIFPNFAQKSRGPGSDETSTAGIKKHLATVRHGHCEDMKNGMSWESGVNFGRHAGHGGRNICPCQGRPTAPLKIMARLFDYEMGSLDLRNPYLTNMYLKKYIFFIHKGYHINIKIKVLRLFTRLYKLVLPGVMDAMNVSRKIKTFDRTRGR